MAADQIPRARASEFLTRCACSSVEQMVRIDRRRRRGGILFVCRDRHLPRAFHSKTRLRF